MKIIFPTTIWGDIIGINHCVIFANGFDFPKLNMFLKKFTPETKSVLNLGLSTLVEFLSGNSHDVIQKWFGIEYIQ